MIVYLWDATGPDRRSRGVTDKKDRALSLAGECLLRGADSAYVEVASFTLGVMTIHHYDRMGTGWRGRCIDGRVMWEPWPL